MLSKEKFANWDYLRGDLLEKIQIILGLDMSFFWKTALAKMKKSFNKNKASGWP